MYKQKPEVVVTTKGLVKNFDIPGRESVHVLTGLNLEIYKGDLDINIIMNKDIINNPEFLTLFDLNINDKG